MVRSFAILSAYLLTPTLGLSGDQEKVTLGLSEDQKKVLDYVKLAYAASYNSYKTNAYEREDKVPNAHIPGESCNLVWTKGEVKNTNSSEASAGAFMRSFSNNDVTVLAFRGTDEHAGFNNDWTNFNFKLHDWKSLSDDPFKALKNLISGKLRKSNQDLFPGFEDYVQKAGFDQWLLEMDQKINTNQQHKIIITGHSLGAAAAYAAATRFATKKKHLQKNLVAVVPFASPFPGGKPFAAKYNILGLCSKTVSFVNTLDLVTKAPLGGRSPCPKTVLELDYKYGSLAHHFLQEDYKYPLGEYLNGMGKNSECAFRR